MNKINTIDLFAGCGGLCEGFEQSMYYNTVACVEWEKGPVRNLIQHLHDKWNYKDAEERVMYFDIQRTDELFNGWHDEKYGISNGLNSIIKDSKIQVIIGGPPCQAYSIAGRIRDKDGMKYDYRNYLFESYCRVLEKLKPDAFIFENVPGILSAKPNGYPIIDDIKSKFKDVGYEIIDNMKNTVIDLSDYGIPQNRKRVIILGLNKNKYNNHASYLLEKFYKIILPFYKVQVKKTVKEAIGDLPGIYPIDKNITINGKKYSHFPIECNIKNHIPRWHNKRDQEIFKILADDIESKHYKYTSSEALKQLYTEKTGLSSNVHKYHVLRWDKPSNLIPAHLHKDGLRHIHPDALQARSITIREAARLQGFPDDYIFFGSQAEIYKMIGNAVPPSFSKILADSLYKLLYQGE